MTLILSSLKMRLKKIILVKTIKWALYYNDEYTSIVIYDGEYDITLFVVRLNVLVRDSWISSWQHFPEIKTKLRNLDDDWRVISRGNDY